MSMNYERVVQWVAGPFAALVGIFAAKAITHWSFLGSSGLGRAGVSGTAVAHAIVTASVFVITALLTWASHNKWLTNLEKWWTVTRALPAKGKSPEPIDTATRLRMQLQAAGKTPVA